MEITALNFEAALPLVLRAIRTSQFIVIDTEFTGRSPSLSPPLPSPLPPSLSSGLSRSCADRGHNLDSDEERY